ncbi:hypothetical protein ACFRAI_39145 [Streptomyces sp. NPDC056637]|uniref:hypothetical protein n=1 Tax=unclassified Streptomyces TaxID=2593676 RepID=UPI0036B5E240
MDYPAAPRGLGRLAGWRGQQLSADGGQSDAARRREEHGEFRSWIGSYGGMPGARIELSEQAADGTWIDLRAWSDGKACEGWPRGWGTCRVQPSRVDVTVA